MKKEELGELIIRNENSLYHIAKSLLYSDEDCKDAIQETIVKAFTKLHTLKKDEFAKSWLVRILINECYTIMRYEKKMVSINEMQDDLEIEESGDYSDLYEAIMHLKEEQRLCIVMYYIEGYSIKEIANMLDTTESAVKKRLVRARSKMKLDLDGGMAL
ncbi:MAG: sigma-70 family RNA polymerase sigma factor [Lachnospiraceae bacterium]|nr:sigma-70 family RNA polymerase sigma factor [Lachnospiraceae bacterium]